GYLEDNSGSYVVNGEPNTVFSGLTFNYGIKSQGAPYDEDYPDALDTLGGSQVLLKYGNNKISAIGYKGIFEGGIKAGSVMLIGFPFETIHNSSARQNLFNAILRYFDFQTSVENNQSAHIEEDVLEQNYPNPFNSNTIIRFKMANDNQVKIIIYNLMGEIIRSFDLGLLEAGTHQFLFDSNEISSGVYFYKLILPNKILTNKMMILK
ncbi:MAG: T9SS type A sorting domain-containing protein, partial [Ignavibacteria bacterium]|nr:T9SS type A sorting domain-containing protein [Ignavibacteria bacterium]